jgi:fatty acid elongase 3
MVSLADHILSQLPPIILPKYLARYIPGETPLSTLPVVALTIVGYLATIFSIQHLMRDQKPYKLTPLFQLHNVFLTSSSGLVRFLFRNMMFMIFF